MTCWADSRDATGRPVGAQYVHTGWIVRVGIAHAFVIGQLAALCGAHRAYDNGQEWPPSRYLADALCSDCENLAGR